MMMRFSPYRSMLRLPSFPLILLSTLLCLQAHAQEEQSTIQQARTLLAKDKSQQAIDLLKEALQIEPSNALLHNELGAAYFQRNDLANATVAFASAVKHDPQLAHAWANLGEARRVRKKYRKAALAYSRFLKLRKGDRYGLYGLALSFEGYEAHDKALRTLTIAERESLTDKPLLARINLARRRIQEKAREASLPFLTRGDARFVAGRYKAAASVYAKGVKAAPKDAPLRARLGLALAVMGDTKRAIPQLRAALTIDPNNDVASFAYAKLATRDESNDGLTLSDLIRKDRAALGVSRAPAAPTTEGAEAALRMGRLDDAYTSSPKDRGAPIRAEIHALRGEWDEADAQLKAEQPTVKGRDVFLWRRSLLTR